MKGKKIEIKKNNSKCCSVVWEFGCNRVGVCVFYYVGEEMVVLVFVGVILLYECLNVNCWVLLEGINVICEFLKRLLYVWF